MRYTFINFKVIMFGFHKLSPLCLVVACLSISVQASSATQEFRVHAAANGKTCIATVNKQTKDVKISEFPARWEDLGISPQEVISLTVANTLSFWPENALAGFENLEYFRTYGPAPDPQATNVTGIRLTTTQRPYSGFTTISCPISAHFADSPKLKFLQLPSLVWEIDFNTFALFKDLTYVDLSACTNLYEVRIGAFSSKGLKIINFSGCKHLTRLHDRIFNDCHNLNAIILPPNLKKASFKYFKAPKNFEGFFWSQDPKINGIDLKKDFSENIKHYLIDEEGRSRQIVLK